MDICAPIAEDRGMENNDTLPKPLSLTHNERLVLEALHANTIGETGGDFGFSEGAFKSLKGMTPQAFAGTFSSLAAKGAFDYYTDIDFNGKQLGSTEFALSPDAKVTLEVSR